MSDESRRMAASDTLDESGFEVFQSQKQTRRLPPGTVSLTKTNLLLSAELAEQLAEAERVVLLYNRQKHEIGIRPAAPDEPGYKISRQRSISSRSFYLHFRIEERGHFKARFDAFGKLIVALRKDASDEPNPTAEAASARCRDRNPNAGSPGIRRCSLRDQGG